MIKKALVISKDSEGVELKTQLTPHFKTTPDPDSITTLRYDFSIRSCKTHPREWSEHCLGSATVVINDNEFTFDEHEEIMTLQTSFRQAEQELPTWLQRSKSALYEDLHGVGYFYNGPFQALDHVFTKPNRSLAHLTEPDTASVMPMKHESPQILHPATIDGFFQAPLCALFEADQLRQTLVPMHIGSLVVDGAVQHQAGQRLTVNTSAVLKGSKSCNVEFHVKAEGDDGEGEGRTLVSGTGIEYISLGAWQDSEAEKSRGRLCNRFERGPVVNFLRASDVRRVLKFEESESSVKEDVHSPSSKLAVAADFYICKAAETLKNWTPTDETPPHMLKLLKWISNQASNAQNGNGTLHSAPDGIGTKSLHGGANGNGTVIHPTTPSPFHSISIMEEFLHKCGPHIPAIIQGTVNPISLMTQDHLLSRILHEDPNFQTSQNHIRTFLQTLKFQNPKPHLLEYGKKISQPSLSFVEECSGGSEVVYEYASHPSAFFFEEEEDAHEQQGIRFRNLNIENDVVPQGFTAGRYDVIVVTSCLHLCASMDKVLGNLRFLLKPSGVLLVLDVVRPRACLNLVHIGRAERRDVGV